MKDDILHRKHLMIIKIRGLAKIAPKLEYFKEIYEK